MIETRHRRPQERYLLGLSDGVKAGLEEVAIDMWEPYRLAIRAALPEAQIVADRFNTERLVSRAFDETRRAVQNSIRRARGREHPSGRKRRLFYARHKLLSGSRRLTLSDLDELAVLFEEHPDLRVAWELMWSFRRVYAAANRAEGQHRLGSWYADVEDSGLRPFAVTATMIFKWEDEVFAYFDSRLTNAYAEGATNKIKVIKRTATASATSPTSAVACWLPADDAMLRQRAQRVRPYWFAKNQISVGFRPKQQVGDRTPALD